MVTHILLSVEICSTKCLEQGEDVTKVCTTFITDLSQPVCLPSLMMEKVIYPYSNVSFNPDIGSWDVSNVTRND